MMPFQKLFEFEHQIAKFFGAPYAVATDCNTHALELCFRLKKYEKIFVPNQTYVSVPFMLEKIGLPYTLDDVKWYDYYYMTNDIIDAAVYWKENGYVSGTKMCLSFHFKKHINIGRGGMVLLDNKDEYDRLVKMRYDGRSIYDGILHKDEDITEIGYHYYMTPETAEIGSQIFEEKRDVAPNAVSYEHYRKLTEFSYFKERF